MIENVMDDLAKEKREKIEREINGLKKIIEETRSRNADSGDLSFDYYQLSCLEKELKELENSI